MQVVFNEEELKIYLNKFSGYKIISIYSIGGVKNWKGLAFNFNENEDIHIASYAESIDIKKPYMFLYSNYIKINMFMKFIRSLKLKNLNKNIFNFYI